VKLTVTSKQGKEEIIAILDGERFFGENALASNRPPRAVNALAVTNVRSVRIDPDLMLHLIHTDPDACDVIISSLIALQVRMIERCADGLLYPRNARLTDALSSIAQLHEGSKVRPVPKLSQLDLANMIGATRKRTRATLKRSKKLGMLMSLWFECCIVRSSTSLERTRAVRSC
jgi:CRP-like cAMP-binding protein